MMHKLLLELPERLETGRLYLRPYRAGDGEWYYYMSLRNKDHLRQFESDNPVMSITNAEEAEILMRELSADWIARNSFFLGVFDKHTDEFLAQIYIGAVNWDTAEFTIGYFADCSHEGQGFVTESVKAALQFIFELLHAHRIRLDCCDTNIRSIRVAERCGFSREAHLRENKKQPDGTYTGTLIFGLLRTEAPTLG